MNFFLTAIVVLDDGVGVEPERDVIMVQILKTNACYDVRRYNQDCNTMLPLVHHDAKNE